MPKIYIFVTTILKALHQVSADLSPAVALLRSRSLNQPASLNRNQTPKTRYERLMDNETRPRSFYEKITSRISMPRVNSQINKRVSSPYEKLLDLSHLFGMGPRVKAGISYPYGSAQRWNSPVVKPQVNAGISLPFRKTQSPDSSSAVSSQTKARVPSRYETLMHDGSISAASLQTEAPVSSPHEAVTNDGNMPAASLQTEAPVSSPHEALTNDGNMPAASLQTEAPVSSPHEALTNDGSMPAASLQTEAPVSSPYEALTHEDNMPAASLQTEAAVVPDSAITQKLDEPLTTDRSAAHFDQESDILDDSVYDPIDRNQERILKWLDGMEDTNDSPPGLTEWSYPDSSDATPMVDARIPTRYEKLMDQTNSFASKSPIKLPFSVRHAKFMYQTNTPPVTPGMDLRQQLNLNRRNLISAQNPEKGKTANRTVEKADKKTEIVKESEIEDSPGSYLDDSTLQRIQNWLNSSKPTESDQNEITDFQN